MEVMCPSSPRYTSENISEARGPSVSVVGQDPKVKHGKTNKLSICVNDPKFILNQHSVSFEPSFSDGSSDLPTINTQ